jgi:hypothetical protein
MMISRAETPRLFSAAISAGLPAMGRMGRYLGY